MWLRRTKRIDIRPMLRGMVDIHSHLLYGVDDGADSADDSLAIIENFERLGISKCYTTPHILPGVFDNSEDWLEEVFHAQITPLLRVYNIDIRLAAEYMVCPEFIDKLKVGHDFLTFAGGHLLLEVDPLNIFSVNTIELFKQIKEIGYRPILAHPERYQFLSKDSCAKLRSQGVSMQLNLLSLSGYYGREVRENALWQLDNLLYDFVGTDCHRADSLSMLRSVELTARQRAIVEKLIINNTDELK